MGLTKAAGKYQESFNRSTRLWTAPKRFGMVRNQPTYANVFALIRRRRQPGRRVVRQNEGMDWDR